MKIKFALFTTQIVANDGQVSNYALLPVSIDTKPVEGAHLLLNALKGC